MPLTLLPSPPAPVTRDGGLAEVEAIYRGQDAEGRKLIVAHAMAVRDVTGRVAQQPQIQPEQP